MSDSTTVKTPVGRVSFPAVFKPAKQKEGEESDPRWEMTLIFGPDTDLKAMKKAAIAAGKEKFGPDAKAKIKKFVNKLFRPCDEADWDGMVDGGTFVKASTKKKNFEVKCRQTRRTLDSEGDFYGGCYAMAMFTAAGYSFTEENGTKAEGIKFYLGNILKFDDGERLGLKQTSADDDFADDFDTSDEFSSELDSDTDADIDLDDDLDF